MSHQVGLVLNVLDKTRKEQETSDLVGNARKELFQISLSLVAYNLDIDSLPSI